MIHHLISSQFFKLPALLLLSLAAVVPVGAASRDHLTPEEADLVRAAQVLDERIDVFVKAIDRRFAALGLVQAPIPTAGAKQKDKQKIDQNWGPMPQGTTSELLSDVSGLLDEAITNIDDVAAREDANKKLLEKSLRKLADAAARFKSQLETLRARYKEGDEREAIEQSIDSANTILEAAGKLPPPEPTTKKSKS